MQGHLVHLQDRRHGGKSTLENQVHQQCLRHIVAVVPERNLIAAEFLRHIEERLAAIPAAEETRIGDLRLRNFSYFCIPDDERHFGFGAERFEVREVGVVVALFDAHMQGGDGEPGLVNLRTATEEFGEQQTVFSTAQTDENMVTVRDELIVRAGLVMADALVVAIE